MFLLHLYDLVLFSWNLRAERKEGKWRDVIGEGYRRRESSDLNTHLLCL